MTTRESSRAPATAARTEPAHAARRSGIVKRRR